VQRAYRARLAAAGKVVRVVDAGAPSPAPASQALASIPDFDPAMQMVCDREFFTDMHDRLHNTLSKLELREQDVIPSDGKIDVQRRPSQPVMAGLVPAIAAAPAARKTQLRAATERVGMAGSSPAMTG
jgi:hypothetical protein